MLSRGGADQVGMIKYNCGGAGLTNGLTTQVQRVISLLPAAAMVQVNLRSWDTNVDFAGQEVLRPFKALRARGAELHVSGRITEEFLQWMTSAEDDDNVRKPVDTHGAKDHDQSAGTPFLVKSIEPVKTNVGCRIAVPIDAQMSRTLVNSSRGEIFSQFSPW